MRWYLVILMFAISGCFKDEPKLPQFYANQVIDVTVDSLICYSAQEDFDNFIIYSSQPYDSIHWFAGSFFNPTFLESSDSLMLPNAPFGFETIRGIGFSMNDSTVYLLRLAYCPRYLYIPIAFSPNGDGINETWDFIYYSTIAGNSAQPYSIYWEIRTMEGVKIFESNDFSPGWDGEYGGESMPSGVYVFYIELLIDGEEPVETTGSLYLIR